MILKKGSSYFGSGGYFAGYRVRTGKVVETPIVDSTANNGFIETHLLDIKAIPGTKALVRVIDGDCISSSGWRSCGEEGVYIIDDAGAVTETICSGCGHCQDRLHTDQCPA